MSGDHDDYEHWWGKKKECADCKNNEHQCIYCSNGSTICIKLWDGEIHYLCKKCYEKTLDGIDLETTKIKKTSPQGAGSLTKWL